MMCEWAWLPIGLCGLGLVLYVVSYFVSHNEEPERLSYTEREIIEEHRKKVEDDLKEREFNANMRKYLSQYKLNELELYCSPLERLIDKRIAELGLMPKGKKK